MTDLVFTRFSGEGGALRYWDLKGPAGLIRFEIADALGIRTASVYLHAAAAPAGAELEDCAVCGQGWHDAMGGEYARKLRSVWKQSGHNDDVIRARLEGWYRENLAVWAAEAEDRNGRPYLALVLAEHAPDLPYVALAILASALEAAGYQLVKAGEVE